MIWKCSVCGFMHEGEEAPGQCPKCGSPKEKYAVLSQEDAKKVYASDRTNDIHMELVSLAMQIEKIAKEGIELNLDPACEQTFMKAKDEAWVIKQRSKAEMAGHVSKGKW